MRFYDFARLRLARFITFTFRSTTRGRCYSDYRGFNRAQAGVFFYLDAHRYEDLPLRDEIRIVTRHWSEVAIMVDDFEVPNDSDYRFDDYGGTEDRVFNISVQSASTAFRPSSRPCQRPTKRECDEVRSCWVILWAQAISLGKDAPSSGRSNIARPTSLAGIPVQRAGVERAVVCGLRQCC
jgi:hypothetical protein